MARVLLQMGHCFRKTGATGTQGLDGDPTEQEFAHAACEGAALLLAAAGHDPEVMFADEARSAYADADAFIAVHCDGSTSGTARGASTGYRNADGAHLAAAFKQAYSEEGWTGWRPDNYTPALAGYYGVRYAVEGGTSYAMIAEAGFLTSPADEGRLSLPEGPARVARAITAAVVSIFGGPNPEDDMPTLDEIRTVIREELTNFQRLPTFWHASTPARVNHWYRIGLSDQKVLVDKDQAQGEVANGLAEWSGTSSQDPDGAGWAAEVSQHDLDAYPTLGSDFYPWEPGYPGLYTPPPPSE